MRYIHWDVLLLQEGSKVPTQEFKTNCYAVQDTEFFSPDNTNGMRILFRGEERMLKETLPKASNDTFENVLPRQIPTVTCFVANLPEGTPFRISLHSWETPTVSSASVQSAAQFGSHVTFEARVLVDEICVG
ncbi:MAG: hypothetical protein Q9187_002053 [Circinaria calcarea]